MAEDRRRLDDRPLLLGQRQHRVAEELGDGPRQRQVGEIGRAGVAGRGDQLLEEERIPAAAVVQRLHGAVRHVVAEGLRREVGDLVEAETVEPDVEPVRAAFDGVEQRRQRRAREQAVWSVGADHDDVVETRHAEHELVDDADRLGVDPVEVVGVHDDGRQVGREMAQHVDRRPFERLHALGRFVDIAAPASRAGVTPARRRDHLGATRLERRRNRCPVAHVRLDGTRERIERLAPPDGITPECDHQRPGGRRRRERIAHETGLADAGLAADERDAGTVAGAENAGETLQLAVAPDDPIRRVRA